jgi:catechol 2,3-dioxygenase-like lactoylglutathione lyase family enzyme
MNLELLEPWHPENDDFLARFVQRHGSGPHHLTFEVDDLEAEADRIRQLGFEPIGLSTDDPLWQELFIHPRQTHGILIQLSRAGGQRLDLAEMVRLARVRGEDGRTLAPYADGTGETGVWWDPLPARAQAAAILRTVVIVTPSAKRSLELFEVLLQGQIVEADGASYELAWPCGARIRLEVRHTEVGRIDRFECEGAGSAWERVVGGARFHGLAADRHSSRGC